MEKLNLSNKNVYAGSGFMRSNITRNFKSKINQIMERSQSSDDVNFELNLLDKRDMIDTGFLYYRKFEQQYSDRPTDSGLIYKYGSRRMKLRLPTEIESDNVWVSVLMTDILVARKSRGSSVNIGFANVSRLWPFHNTYSSSTYLYDFISPNTHRQIFEDNQNNKNKDYLQDHYLDQVCLGESVSSIDLDKTPELYTHTLLTSISNYDLSCGYSLHFFITDDDCKEFKSSMMNKVIDLSKVSNLFKGLLYSNDLINCKSFDDIIELLEDHINHEVDNKLYLPNYNNEYNSLFEWMMKFKRESSNLIIAGILSAFGNVKILEEALKL